jgi:hypothetical protein
MDIHELLQKSSESIVSAFLDVQYDLLRIGAARKMRIIINLNLRCSTTN